MTQLSHKYHTKMKSLNRRRRCSCCFTGSNPHEPQTSTSSNSNGEQASVADIPLCYEVSIDTNVKSRIRPRRNEKTTKPLLHTMMIIMMMTTWAATQRLPQHCASFTVVLKNPIQRKHSHLHAVAPSLPSENSKKGRSSNVKRKQIAKTAVTATSSSSTTSAVTESLTEQEMKRSMLSTKNEEKRKKLLRQQDFQLEASMLRHDILSKEQEYELVDLYHTAKELQLQINNILLQKQKQQQLDLKNINDRENFVLNELGMNDFDDDDENDEDEDNFDELYTSLLRSKGGDTKKRKKRSKSMNTYSDYMEYQQEGHLKDDDDDFFAYTDSVTSKRQLLLEQLDQSSRTTMASILLEYPTLVTTVGTNDDVNNVNTKSENSGGDSDYDAFTPVEFDLETVSTTNTKWKDSDQRSSSMSATNLSESDIVELLNIPGGRKEMEHILLIGAQARDTLIRSNLKLVSSICKKWARMSSGSRDGNAKTRTQADSYFSIYQWELGSTKFK